MHHFALLGTSDPSQHTFNGSSLILPFEDDFGNMVTGVGRSIKVRIPSLDTIISWNGGSTVSVRILERSVLKNNTCGLCGNSDGDLKNDRSAIAMHDYWRINDTQLIVDALQPAGRCRSVTAPNP